MKDYNLTIANMIANYFSEATGFDLKSNTRTPKYSYLKSLLYKMFKEYNDMNDRMISDYFRDTVGVSKNRSAIYTSLNKIDVYYLNYEEFRDYYDAFFKDKIEQRGRKTSKRKAYLLVKKIKESKFKASLSYTDLDKIELGKTISKLPDDRFKDIKDLVELRIKSWSWKSKDDCEIIECSGMKQ
tara:strand:+ start:973 stop:1524 length:552 start_codon:yes stop_codon:yes gene_type:complete